ncbi:unnamed protein product [Didymodactylos carnosus]|uniref:EGF-like domain-containing protein n=1 Tax=Didymodactylos carnosus TaxID=1234261 RepID=A0A8S2J1M8_9BILA|nr:unnamed protein product [Didymodactylos carnosus]CAF3786813.1 unnamed protein product [Didymodactylos carnosus]
MYGNFTIEWEVFSALDCDITTVAFETSSITTTEIDISSNPLISTQLDTSTSTSQNQTVTTTTNPYFVSNCNSSGIGPNCNISTDACTMSHPCQNDASCFPNNTLPLYYTCNCIYGYTGYDCQNDERPCKENTCWNNGSCSEVNMTNFRCDCVEGYSGINCQLVIDDCSNITCQNNGFCVSLVNSWRCECLDDSMYDGAYCQYKSQSLVIKEWVAKSFGFVAIGAIITVCLFVIIMDILRYFFKIDPVYENEKKRKAKHQLQNPGKQKPVQIQSKPIALRFQYVQ